MKLRLAATLRRFAAAIGLGAACAVAGCATQNVDIRSLPPENPAAENAAAAESAAALEAAIAGESTGAAGDHEEAPPPVTPADAPSMSTYDPWSRLNRFTYRFNARFDRAVFLPVANGYLRLPSPLRAGVHNFFGNLAEVDSVINYALQWRLLPGLRSLGRLVINSTIGIGGLIDVAKHFKLAAAPTGFSNTLSTWGLHPGPYLVMPLLGPSTLRDGIGWLGDFGTSHIINLANLYRGDKTWSLTVVDVVDQRADNSFRYYSTGSPFEYETIRFLYVRKRLLEDAGLHRTERPKPQPAGVPAGQ